MYFNKTREGGASRQAPKYRAESIMIVYAIGATAAVLLVVRWWNSKPKGLEKLHSIPFRVVLQNITDSKLGTNKLIPNILSPHAWTKLG